MLSSAYFLAKFRFDTAENEPAKNLQILQTLKFANLLILLVRGPLAQVVLQLELCHGTAGDLARRLGPMREEQVLAFLWQVARAAVESSRCSIRNSFDFTYTQVQVI